MSEAPANPFAILAERSEERRTKKQYSQPELIRRMNATRFHPRITSQGHISNIEGGGGRRLPSVPALAAMAEVLDTNMDYLVGLSDNPAPAREGANRVAVNATDTEERALLQELFDLIHSRSRAEQQFIADVVRRLAAAPAPKPPVIIGNEPDPAG